jgi:hypothetical protein
MFTTLSPSKSSLLAGFSELITRPIQKHIFQFLADSRGADHETDHHYWNDRLRHSIFIASTDPLMIIESVELRLNHISQTAGMTSV